MSELMDPKDLLGLLHQQRILVDGVVLILGSFRFVCVYTEEEHVFHKGEEVRKDT